MIRLWILDVDVRTWHLLSEVHILFLVYRGGCCLLLNRGLRLPRLPGRHITQQKLDPLHSQHSSLVISSNNGSGKLKISLWFYILIWCPPPPLLCSLHHIRHISSHLAAHMWRSPGPGSVPGAWQCRPEPAQCRQTSWCPVTSHQPSVSMWSVVSVVSVYTSHNIYICPLSPAISLVTPGAWPVTPVSRCPGPIIPHTENFSLTQVFGC